MISVSLSNIELYYTSAENYKENKVLILGEECNHIIKVMRHFTGDKIFVTDGTGQIYHTKIIEIKKTSVLCEIEDISRFENKYSNIFFCLPKLKSYDRFEFALEKAVELGITNFITFNAKNSVAKGGKIERWQKIIFSAMKQSLRSYLPRIHDYASFEEIFKLSGEKILFDQNSLNTFSTFKMDIGKKYYFIFGPEGGLAEQEINLAKSENVFNLSPNRLRTETAVVYVASILSNQINY